MSIPPQPILIPPALRRGDTIAFISPSSRLNEVFPLRVERAHKFLESEGFKVKEIYSPVPKDHQAALQHRVDEIHAAFTDPTVRAIIPAIGGFALNQLLPHLNYALLRANPKILLGYSDTTLLHSVLYARSGLRTFYGPHAIAELGEYAAPLQYTWSNLISTLSPETPGVSLPGVSLERGGNPVMPRASCWTQEFRDWTREKEPGFLRWRTVQPTPTGTELGAEKFLAKGYARGRVLGGCLPSLVQLLGTPYGLPVEEYQGAILLLETPESAEDPGRGWPLVLARQGLGDLRNAGVLGLVGGIVVGRPKGYGGGGQGLVGMEWEAWERMLEEELGGLGVPVLVNVSVGHTDPVLTVPLGAEAVLCSGKYESDGRRFGEWKGEDGRVSVSSLDPEHTGWRIVEPVVGKREEGEVLG
ncbi:MAG: hypothetical protein MMC23_008800 [Stictis urceolatum]|nr:hypothetical protein [Stictis urceolata]